MDDIGSISDGYHTFNELYAHRSALMIALMSLLQESWWSTQHFDGSMFPGYVICGIDLPDGTVTYHLEEKYTEDLIHSGVVQRDKAPEWDGHSSDDVLARLLAFSRSR
jgi:hypothetical protein